MKTCWDYPEGKLVLGDCLKILPTLPESSIDLVVGSPPYEDSRTYGIGFKLKGQDWVDWMVEVVKASLRVCRGLVAFVIGHGKGARRWSGVPALLMADLIRGGVCVRSPFIYERVGIIGSGTTDWLRADCEWIVCATNNPEKLPWSDNTACGHPPKYGPGGSPSHRTVNGERVSPRLRVESLMKKRGISRLEALRQLGMKVSSTETQPKGERRRADYVHPDISNPGNVIRCAVGGGKLGSQLAHENEAPYPEKIPNFFIRSFCPLGGTVLDPFGGSGTTLATAVKTGRKFICCDVRKSQIKLMRLRLREARRKRGFLEL